MSKLISSREAMDDFVILLKRYSAQCQKCIVFDSGFHKIGRYNTHLLEHLAIPPQGKPFIALSALARQINERLATADFLAPYGWPDAVEQAFESLRSD